MNRSVQSVGFSSVQVPTLDLDTVSSTYNISFFVPSLDMNGSYDCSGSYSLFLPIFGSGQFRITLYNVSGHGSATVNYGGKLTPFFSFHIKQGIDLDYFAFLEYSKKFFSSTEWSRCLNWRPWTKREKYADKFLFSSAPHFTLISCAPINKCFFRVH